MSTGTLILRYGLFAVIATLANLVTQRGILTVDTSAAGFAIAVAVGTLVGLMVKYLLDRRWIFGDDEAGLQAHRRKFVRYTGTGVLTTLIFWGSETGFWLIWRDDLMREVGAILGLAVGYVVKYHFDRRYVFGSRAEGPT